MRKNLFHGILLFAFAVFTGSCAKQALETASTDPPITISGSIGPFTRANDTGFQANDSIGVFIVLPPNNLVAFGNHADNISFKYNGSSWEALNERKFYWPEGSNPTVDLYGYYPYTTVVNSVLAFPFEVQIDQNSAQAGTMMNSYEASDFLWGRTVGIAPTSDRIPLLVNHLLSKINITITSGEGVEGMDATQPKVFVHNVKRSATINLRSGAVTLGASNNDPVSIVPIRSNETGIVYKAIVIPQTVTASDFSIEVRLGTDVFTYVPLADPVFKTGMQLNFTLTLRKTGVKSAVTGEVFIGEWREA